MASAGELRMANVEKPLQFLILNFPISPSTSTRSSIFFARSIRNLASIMRLRIRLSKLSLATLGSSLSSELEVGGDVKVGIALFYVVEEVFGGAVVACVRGG